MQTVSLYIYCLIIWILCLPLALSAQQNDWILHVSGIGTAPLIPTVQHHLAQDASGNIYLIGSVADSMQMGPFALHGTEVLPGTGIFLNASYLAKLNAAGEPQWVKPFYGTGILTFADIAVDQQGDVYVTGVLQNAILLDTISLETNFSSGEMILAKFNTDGEIQWVSMSDSQPGFSSATGHAVTVGPDGKIIVAGTIDNHVIFEGISIDVSENLFMASYNSDGTINWARPYGAINPLQTDTEVGVDQNNHIYWVGQTALQSADISVFDTISLTPSVGATFLGKFDTKGDVIWLNLYGGSDPDDFSNISARNLVVDRSDNSVSILGNFTDTVTIGGRTLIEPSVFGNHLFLAKFDAQGSLQWAKQSHGVADRIIPNDLALNDEGDLFVVMEAASSQGLAQFTIGEGNHVQQVTINGELNGVLAKYQGNGEAAWMKGISGFEASPIQTVIATGSNTAVIGGYFTNDIQIGGTSLTSTPLDFSGNPFLASCNGNLASSVDLSLAGPAILSLFPNPTADRMHLQWQGDQGIDQVRILNQAGQQVKTVSLLLPQRALELSLTDLPVGIYHIHVMAGNQYAVQRFVRQ